MANEGHEGNLMQAELFSCYEDIRIKFTLLVQRHVLVELFRYVERDTQRMNELMQTGEATIFPKCKLGGQVM